MSCVCLGRSVLVADRSGGGEDRYYYSSWTQLSLIDNARPELYLALVLVLCICPPGGISSIHLLLRQFLPNTPLSSHVRHSYILRGPQLPFCLILALQIGTPDPPPRMFRSEPRETRPTWASSSAGGWTDPWHQMSGMALVAGGLPVSMCAGERVCLCCSCREACKQRDTRLL